MSTLATDRPLLTVRDTAAMLRVSEKTVRRLIDNEFLPALRVGGSIRISADDLDTWLEKEERQR
jgi:excisionase family DNA binding protein